MHSSDGPASGRPPKLVTGHAIVAVLARPHLWLDAVLALGRLARRDWWKHWPPVPRPDPEYLAWREQTHYGSDVETDPRLRADDLVSYLEFCRSHRRA